jgi:hypothetical protein
VSKQLELYQEYPEPGEEVVAQELAEYLTQVVVAQKNFLSGATQRDVHGKSVAALKAELIVDDDISPELRYGVFAQKKSYPCWIRLSNSGQHPAKDYKPDIRGFAIKLMGVEGEKLLPEERWATTQDFTFLTTENFFSRDTAQFFGLVRSLNTNLLAAAWFALTNPRAALAGFLGFKRFANLLEVQFWSTTPYRLGPTIAVKYSVKPRAAPQSKIPDDPGRNYLREAAARTLRQGEVLYDFYVQVQVDPYREPIEDGLKIWSTELSPLQKVATIRIPQQEIDTSERNWTAENLSYNAWHSLADHRPLGNLNRGRLLAYLEVSKFRRTRNLLPPLEEPTAGPDFFADCGPTAVVGPGGRA